MSDITPVGGLKLQFSSQAVDYPSWSSGIESLGQEHGKGIACWSLGQYVYTYSNEEELQEIESILRIYTADEGLSMYVYGTDPTEISDDLSVFPLNGDIKLTCDQMKNDQGYKCYLPEYCGPDAPANSLDPSGSGSGSNTGSSSNSDSDLGTNSAFNTASNIASNIASNAASGEASQTAAGGTSSTGSNSGTDSGSVSESSSASNTASVNASETAAGGASSTGSNHGSDSNTSASSGSSSGSDAGSKPEANAAAAASSLIAVNPSEVWSNRTVTTSTQRLPSTTVVTITSCESHVCSEAVVTTGVTTVIDVSTTHTTYCPLSGFKPSTAAPKTTVSPSGGTQPGATSSAIYSSTGTTQAVEEPLTSASQTAKSSQEASFGTSPGASGASSAEILTQNANIGAGVGPSIGSIVAAAALILL